MLATLLRGWGEGEGVEREEKEWAKGRRGREKENHCNML